MKLLPQPHNSVDKKNFKNRLCWSHDIILQIQRLLNLLKCKLLSHLHQSVQICYVENPNHKITNNSPFDFFGTTAKKLLRTPCLFAAISNRWSMCFEFTWSVMQMLHNNCDRKFLVATCAMKPDAIVDATFITLLRKTSVICLNLYTNSVNFLNKIAIIRRFRN